MKKLLIVANWKSNMTLPEARKWLQELQISNVNSQISNKDIVICPPFTLLDSLHSYFVTHDSKMRLGSQDVSPFPKGAYTGEVSAAQLSELVAYVIIGHSERRKYFHEDDQMLSNKVEMALDAGLTPILCVQNAETLIPKGVRIVAYEPVFAIGTGEPDSPENADTVAREIKETSKITTVLYGGSVTEKNVHTFTETEHIDGVLVGGASLDPVSFSHIIENA